MQSCSGHATKHFDIVVYMFTYLFVSTMILLNPTCFDEFVNHIFCKCSLKYCLKVITKLFNMINYFNRFWGLNKLNFKIIYFPSLLLFFLTQNGNSF